MHLRCSYNWGFSKCKLKNVSYQKIAALQDQNNYPKIGRNYYGNHMRIYSRYLKSVNRWWNHQHGRSLSNSHLSILKRACRANKKRKYYRLWNHSDQTFPGLTPPKTLKTPNHPIETLTPNQMIYSTSI